MELIILSAQISKWRNKHKQMVFQARLVSTRHISRLDPDRSIMWQYISIMTSAGAGDNSQSAPMLWNKTIHHGIDQQPTLPMPFNNNTSLISFTLN